MDPVLLGLRDLLLDCLHSSLSETVKGCRQGLAFADFAFAPLLQELAQATPRSRAETFQVRCDQQTGNVVRGVACVRAAGRLLKADGGSVVLVSSAAARIGLANHEAIAAAKAGIIGLVRSAAATYSRPQIRFNAVAPGLVKTPLASGITSNDLATKASVGMHPLGRLGEPEDVARAITFLLDPANDWVTGQVLGVDGGLADLKARSG